MTVRFQPGSAFAVLSLLGILVLVRGQPAPGPAFSLAEDDRMIVFRKSAEFEASQNYPEAIQILQGLTRNPADYLLDMRLGWLNYCAGNQATAAWHYEQAGLAAPQALEPRVALLLPLLAQERYAEVELVGRSILTTAPDHYLTALRLTYAYRKLGKLAPADHLNERMLSLYPSDVTFLLEQAAVRQAQNRPREAGELYRLVLLLSPTNKVAQRGLHGS